MDWNPNQQPRMLNGHSQEENWGFCYWGGSNRPKSQNPSLSPHPISEYYYPLSRAQVGAKVWLKGLDNPRQLKQLLNMGFIPNAPVQVVSTLSSGSVVVLNGSKHIGIGVAVAESIAVSNRPEASLSEEKDPKIPRTFLKDMNRGTVACVVGYDRVRGGYQGKLLSMGLKPGTELTLINVDPLAKSVEILVAGYPLSLSKPEADALIVEEICSV